MEAVQQNRTHEVELVCNYYPSRTRETWVSLRGRLPDPLQRGVSPLKWAKEHKQTTMMELLEAAMNSEQLDEVVFSSWTEGTLEREGDQGRGKDVPQMQSKVDVDL